MDPRIREHARIVTEHSTDVDAGDNVVIFAPSGAEDMVVALHEECGDRGANPVTIWDEDRADRAFLDAVDGDFETPGHERALYEASDVFISCRADRNATELADIPPAVTAAYSRARHPLREIRLDGRWCVTQVPSAGNAQLASMSSEAYENFVWDAINRDWDAQEEFQAQLVDILDPADEVRIVSGDRTDITMRIGGNHAINDFGEHNMPGGEVFTAPVPDSVAGSVLFDKPIYYQGREIRNAYLEFESGRAVAHAAETNEELLGEILETDADADRLGELGIGMNRAIDRFTYNVLFDEKMGDTVHLAVGMAYDECVGEENEKNDSAVHVDMIVDMAENSRIEVDGEIIQEDGRFTFEDG